ATRAGADGVARIRRRLNQYKVEIDPNTLGMNGGNIRVARKRLSGGTTIETRKAPSRSELSEERIRELGVNHEQGNVTDLREGVGGARYEQTTGNPLGPSTTEGVDFYDGDTPISLKGPLARKDTGELLPINDSMVDGLADSVVKGAKTNTATRDIVVDTLGLSDTQRHRLTERIKGGLENFDAMPTNIVILE
uniref:hypothetical protein n=1 Tax=uncultured Litoreibacter sp. TaxID=1392394 RepID=UPI00260C62BA